MDAANSYAMPSAQQVGPAVTLAPATAATQAPYSSSTAPSTSVDTLQYGGNGYASSPGNAVAPSGTAAPFGLSSWITYTRPDCCGPIGGDGPICAELYARTGPSIPAGGHILEKVLDTGWDFTGGGRSLFFNSDRTAAWTVDLGLTYIYNHSKNTPQVTINNGLPVTATMVTLRDLQRTFANAAIGREWYLLGAANCGELTWRVGCDFGGRLGTAKMDFAEIRHTTDTIYGYFCGLHTDLEKPFGCCTGQIGFRVEWGQTIMDFLQPFQNSNVQDVDLLLTLGVRF
jgi:hypothetical protein